MEVGTRMIRHLGQGWRICASGIAFAVFGIAGILVSLLVFPVLFLLPLGRVRRARLARALIAKSFWLFTRLLAALRLIRPQLASIPDFQAGIGSVIIANHPTLIDVVYLLSRLPDCICIVNLGVWNNPCMRVPVRTAGFVPNRDAEQLIEDCVSRLMAGQSILLFPEGTRSHPDKLRAFQRGFATIAIRSGAPVLPLVITCTPPTLSKGRAWYQMASRCCDLILYVRDPIDISPFASRNRNASLAARELTQHLECLYQEELKGYYAEC
jgi:1-acyl-sn-glycerol-3-phosphate acyltransferase